MQLEVPVIGILRGINGDFFRELLPVAFAAGLTALEITMNTPGAAEIVKRCRPGVPPGKLLGMGTIRNVAEAEIALAAGAMFLVTPNTDPKVIELAKNQEIPVIAGAFTPTEVYAAWSAGADLVKIFPCGAVGPDYLRELRGPFDHIPLVAVGGVHLNNLRDFFAAGAVAVGVGNSLFGQAALAELDLAGVAANVRRFLAALPPRP
ncbi:MAG: 2-dehydro-3-deoxyphosphogluconate aldolase [Desulfobulbaceae bacterium]|nr:2-dehydro-3-deoxyphosphogluconate aldolase [Desulfobulbaceae bacterium]